MGHLETAGIQPRQDFGANAGPGIRPGLDPGRHGGFGCRNKRVGTATRVGNVEPQAVGRDFRAAAVDHARLIQIELRAAIGLEGLASVLDRRVAVNPRILGIGTPVAARFDRGNGLLQQGLMFLEQGMGHLGSPGEGLLFYIGCFLQQGKIGAQSIVTHSWAQLSASSSGSGWVQASISSRSPTLRAPQRANSASMSLPAWQKVAL